MMQPEVHHRHLNDPANCHRESAPLLIRLGSTPELEAGHERLLKFLRTDGRAFYASCHGWRIAAFVLGFVAMMTMVHWHPRKSSGVIPIEEAVVHWLDLPDRMYDEKGSRVTLRLWLRTWGRNDGIPILFIHGGPGDAIADYHNENAWFFDDSVFYVVEIDQRGTGNSQPSVRDDWRNMKYYSNISIDVISEDFELVRESLGIEKWLVFGGSFGSTIGLNYGMRFPERCLALILRGIYLDTPKEVESVYSRKPYLNNPKRLAEFDTLFKAAVGEAHDDRGQKASTLDPNNAEQLLLTYERLIRKGDRKAIWHWHVFENNLMEEDPQKLLDPNVIKPAVFPQAQSVAFFETRLSLRGSYEDPSNLLDRVGRLSGQRIWICQGLHDEVCPPENAQLLLESLEKVHTSVQARFVDGRHEAIDPAIEQCLQKSIHEFLHYAQSLERD